MKTGNLQASFLGIFVSCLIFQLHISGAEEGAYSSTIKETFRERCYACHGALKQKAGLRLDTAGFIRQGSGDGPVIDTSSPAASELIRRLESHDPLQQMPPEGTRVPREVIGSIIQWIGLGAHGPEGEEPEVDPTMHWAFQPPVSSLNPQANRNVIDRILADHHATNNITPFPLAEERVLVRRLYLDLIGLPPSLEQYRDYFEMHPEDRWSRTVDSLLASPQYGERWARHWMDVWRYSDWYGLDAQLRYSQKHIWHWRDWMIESLNADKGYDRMVTEMLAADELSPTDFMAHRATGFLARNYYLFNRTTWLDQTIEHVGKGFLGLTIHCAKCHDHKYDPISQWNYYQFRAFFEPHQIRLDPVPGSTEVSQNGIPRAFDAYPDIQTFLHIRGEEKNPDQSRPVIPGLPEVFSSSRMDIVSQKLHPAAYNPSLRGYVHDDRMTESQRQVFSAEQKLAELLQRPHAPDGESPHITEARYALAFAQSELEFRRLAWEAEKSAYFPAPANPNMNSESSHRQHAADAWKSRELSRVRLELHQAQMAFNQAPEDKKKQTQEKLHKLEAQWAECQVRNWGLEFPIHQPAQKALESPDESEESRRQPFPDFTTGRRLALARWIASPENPLTARVAVNHIWLRHFGEPLVESMSDFGRRQKAPKLQDLLDELAQTFVHQGWSMKSLHRLIVTSDAWKRSASPPSDQKFENGPSDPINAFFWKRHSTRLESQTIRDSVLFMAGALDPTQFGPSVPAHDSQSPHRRSLYFLHSRDDQNPFLMQFDDADIQSCYRREESIIPQQALAMANSQLTISMAEKIASHLGQWDGDPSPLNFIQNSFHLLLGRNPDAEESSTCLEFLSEIEAPRNRTLLIHSLLNHNDFITIR